MRAYLSPQNLVGLLDDTFRVTINGLVNGYAQDASITYEIDPDNGTHDVKWSASPDPEEEAAYGFGDSPSDIPPVGSSLYLHVTEGADTETYEVIVAAPIVLSVPEPFGFRDWSIVAPGISGQLDVTITNYPANGNSPLLNVQYQLDDGPWVSVGLVRNFSITDLPDGIRVSVGLRATNAIGAGEADVKAGDPIGPRGTIEKFTIGTQKANGNFPLSYRISAPGNLLVSVTTSDVTPTPQQVTAGQDHSGSGASATASGYLDLSGDQILLPIVGQMIEGTDYYAHVVVEGGVDVFTHGPFTGTSSRPS